MDVDRHTADALVAWIIANRRPVDLIGYTTAAAENGLLDYLLANGVDDDLLARWDEIA